MNELIIRYCHGDKPTFQVGYRSKGTIRETDRFPFTFSISKEDRKRIQEYLEEYRIYPYGAFQYRAKLAEKVIYDTGTALFNEIFHNKEDKAQATIRFYNRAIENPTACHIIIQSDHVTGWSLPWEFIHDPAYGYLAQKVAGFVRSQLGVQMHLKPIRIKDTFKINILLIVSRPDGEEEKVLFQSMARPLLEIFRPHKARIHVDLLRPPTFERLRQVLSKKPNFYHILHFDGHGEFSQPIRHNSNTFLSEEEFPGKLAFRKIGGGVHLVSGAKLGKLLSGKGVSVVILNACQSGMTDPDVLYPSVGGELIKTGALGVVAMAYSVFVDTAVEFMKQVYESLINSKTLSRAVTVARKALAESDERNSPIGMIPLQDWVVPVLFQSGEVQLFPPSEKKVNLGAKIIKGKTTDPGTAINLPGEPDYKFIGRDTDILRLEESFEKETIVLLQAMAGVGKSATAVGFARWWEETGALQGPIFFFSFESYTTLLQVCDQIGDVLREKIKAELKVEWHFLDIAQRIRVTISILRQIPCLLIWDNFEPVAGFPPGAPSSWKEEEQEELKEFLEALNGGATKIILISRIDERWLGRCYKTIKLQGLNSLDTMTLAGKVLDRAGVNRQELRPYDKLLNYLQGNPLAIRVILPELAHLEPEELLIRLQTGETELSEEDKKQDREHSLTASLSYGLDKLDKLLRSRLGLLGLFQGFVGEGILTFICNTKEAPELLLGLTQDDWLKMLDQAAQIGLLQKVRTGFYRAHPALPWFFHEILHNVFGKDIRWLKKRFVAAYGLLSPLFQLKLHTDAEIAMINLHLEEQNLNYGMKLGVHYRMWEAVNYIFMFMADMLQNDNRWPEIESLTVEVERKVTDTKDIPFIGAKALCASLWIQMGFIAQKKRQFAEAKQWYRKSLAIAEKLKNEWVRAFTLAHLGTIAEEKRQFAEAKQWYRKSLVIKEKLKDEQGQAITLHHLGRIAEEREQFAEAKKWYRKSLAIGEKLKNEHIQAITLHHLGIIAQEKRQFTEAEQWYRKSLAIKEKLKDEYRKASTLHQMGIIAQERRQFTEAEQWYRKSLAIKEKLKDEYAQTSTLHCLGTIAQKKRQFAEAKKWYRKSLVIEEKLKDEQGQAITLHHLGRIAEEREQFAEAKKWYRKSLVITGRLKNEHGQSQTLHQLGTIAKEKRQFTEAEKWYRESLALSKKLKDEHGQVSTLHQLGRIAKEKREFDKAEQWYRKSLAIAEKLKDEYGQAITLHQLGMLAEPKSKFNEAEKLYLKAVALFKKYHDEQSIAIVQDSLKRVRSKKGNK